MSLNLKGRPINGQVHIAFIKNKLNFLSKLTQRAFTLSKSIMETSEQCVNSVQIQE